MRAWAEGQHYPSTASVHATWNGGKSTLSLGLFRKGHQSPSKERIAEVIRGHVMHRRVGRLFITTLRT